MSKSAKMLPSRAKSILQKIPLLSRINKGALAFQFDLRQQKGRLPASQVSALLLRALCFLTTFFVLSDAQPCFSQLLYRGSR